MAETATVVEEKQIFTYLLGILCCLLNILEVAIFKQWCLLVVEPNLHSLPGWWRCAVIRMLAKTQNDPLECCCFVCDDAGCCRHKEEKRKKLWMLLLVVFLLPFYRSKDRTAVNITRHQGNTNSLCMRLIDSAHLIQHDSLLVRGSSSSSSGGGGGGGDNGSGSGGDDGDRDGDDEHERRILANGLPNAHHRAPRVRTVACIVQFLEAEQENGHIGNRVDSNVPPATTTTITTISSSSSRSRSDDSTAQACSLGPCENYHRIITAFIKLFFCGVFVPTCAQRLV